MSNSNSWNQLLKDTLNKTQLVQKNLLVVGNNGTGKRTLINKLKILS